MYKFAGLFLLSLYFTPISARNDTILHGWHSESLERGTWSILWGCFATIFICTWSVLHLNVPPRSASDLRRFTQKVGQTLLAIIGPEIFLAAAINETLLSRMYKKEIDRHVNRQQGREAWSLIHVRFMLADGFTKTTESDDVWKTLEEVVNIPQEPPISKKELKSRSTTDWIANTLAIFQISWFGAQLLVRRIQHLHITAMEILTLAFIVCSIFTYILCWPQPQNVAYPVVLPPLEETPPERPATASPRAPLNTALEESPAIETAHPFEHSPPNGSGALDKSDEVQERASNFSKGLDRVNSLSMFLLGFAGAVFGAVHCLAWNSTFPTPKERLAWRVCSVATTALPIICVSAAEITINILTRTGEQGLEGMGLIYRNNLYVSSIAYVFGRLTLIALALASLRAVPADVFQTTDWNNIIPHVGL